MARGPFRSRPKSQEFDITALANAQAPKSGLFCLSPATWELAYNLILHYGYWRSRYYYTDPSSGDQLTITDDEYTQVTDLVDGAIEELQMGTCDDLLAAINNLANITANCSSTSACSTSYGTIPQEATDPGDHDTQTPPPGFADWPTYTAYKCRAANRIVDEWIETVRNLSTLGGIGAAIGAAGLALFLQTSLLSGILVGVMALGFSAGTAAALVIGALITLILGNAAQFAFFDDLADDLEANKTAFVCDLFDSDSVEQAYQRVGLLTLAYASLDEPFNSVLTDLITHLFNPDILNILFAEDAETSTYVGTVDCAACVPFGGCPFVFSMGSGTIHYDGSEFIMSSEEQSPGVHTLDVSTACGGAGCPDPINWCVQFTATDIVPYGPTTFTRRIYAYTDACAVTTDFYDDNVKDPSFPALDTTNNLGRIWLSGSSPFTVTAKIVGGPNGPVGAGEGPLLAGTIYC